MPECVIALNMALTLRGVAPARFSKTARSHPRHREAARNRRCRRTRAVLGRRSAYGLAERPAERPEAREPDVEAHRRDAQVGLAQQRHCTLHAPPLEVAVRRLAEDLAEGSDEVRLGDD